MRPNWLKVSLLMDLKSLGDENLISTFIEEIKLPLCSEECSQVELGPFLRDPLVSKIRCL